tara:strand:- start:619 stop:1038 length:420 start_codon:yes stop_codon:yes gene_type:complete
MSSSSSFITTCLVCINEIPLLKGKDLVRKMKLLNIKGYSKLNKQGKIDLYRSYFEKQITDKINNNKQLCRRRINVSLRFPNYTFSPSEVKIINSHKNNTSVGNYLTLCKKHMVELELNKINEVEVINKIISGYCFKIYY